MPDHAQAHFNEFMFVVEGLGRLLKYGDGVLVAAKGPEIQIFLPPQLGRAKI